MVTMDEDEYLAHYGILRKSGRYPWGSGETQSARNKMFLDMVSDLRRQGLSPVEICRGFDIKDENGNVTEAFSTTQLRAATKIAKNEQKQAQIHQAQKLKDKGLSNVAIGQRMGINESSVRALLDPGAKIKADVLTTTANMLKDQVAEKRFVDVGSGVHHHIGVSKSMLDGAVAMLREDGYEVRSIPVEQLGTGQNTNVKVLAPPGTSWYDVKRDQSIIKQVTMSTEDGGLSYRGNLGIRPPLSIDPKRVDVKYKEDGGAEADGVIFVRPGVKDVSIGGSSYAQVRIAVGKGHYLKGMAMYKTDLPEGIDIQFNTNKKRSGDKLAAMKEMNKLPDGTIDKDNPFGSNIKRQIIESSGGKERVTSAMNIVNEEGNWSEWSRTLSSQMLSKQNPSLVREQLDRTFKQRTDEFNTISSLTNPSVRRKLLEEFGSGTDSAAVHLKAAAIPRTHGHHVILPISTMPPTQIYAPNYRHGERVVLIRHPHGGRFEIPELVVNNNQKEAKRLLGSARDAVGIHHSVAERLSGADFDGDTVLVIPNTQGKVKTAPALDRLKNFDPRSEYRGYEGMPKISPQAKQNLMGDVSNLITDMTIKRASTQELAQAVRHSMVVIDAEKHNLNYRQSAIDHGIAGLKKKYQGSSRSGAATLISRSGLKPNTRVPQRVPRKASRGGPIDPKTGRLVFEETGAGYTNAKGVFIPKTSKVAKLAVTDDAHTLSSGTHIERIYADHSNRLKALANESRRIAVNTKPLQRSPSAAKTYSKEVSSLTAQLKLAERNAPLERQSQLIATAIYKQKLIDNPDMDDATKKKIKFQALTEARNRMGAGKEKIVVTPKEWEAIQAGALSPTKLDDVLVHANMDVIRKLATPRTPRLMSTSKLAQAKSLLDAGYTRAEVADRLGVSVSTLDLATKGDGP